MTDFIYFFVYGHDGILMAYCVYVYEGSDIVQWTVVRGGLWRRLGVGVEIRASS